MNKLVETIEMDSTSVTDATRQALHDLLQRACNLALTEGVPETSFSLEHDEGRLVGDETVHVVLDAIPGVAVFITARERETCVASVSDAESAKDFRFNVSFIEMIGRRPAEDTVDIPSYKADRITVTYLGTRKDQTAERPESCQATASLEILTHTGAEPLSSLDEDSNAQECAVFRAAAAILLALGKTGAGKYADRIAAKASADKTRTSVIVAGADSMAKTAAQVSEGRGEET